VARRASGLALALVGVGVGVVELVVIDLASVVTITPANGRGSTGAIVIFNYTSQVFNSVAAVLALLVVVSAFPVLSARTGPNSTGPAPGPPAPCCCCPGSVQR